MHVCIAYRHACNAYIHVCICMYTCELHQYHVQIKYICTYIAPCSSATAAKISATADFAVIKNNKNVSVGCANVSVRCAHVSVRYTLRNYVDPMRKRVRYTNGIGQFRGTTIKIILFMSVKCAYVSDGCSINVSSYVHICQPDEQICRSDVQMCRSNAQVHTSVRCVDLSTRCANMSVGCANVSFGCANVSARYANVSVRYANVSVRYANVSVRYVNVSVRFTSILVCICSSDAHISRTNSSASELLFTVSIINLKRGSLTPPSQAAHQSTAPSTQHFFIDIILVAIFRFVPAYLIIITHPGESKFLICTYTIC